MSINKNFVHQAGDEPRLYYNARSTNHQERGRSSLSANGRKIVVYDDITSKS